MSADPIRAALERLLELEWLRWGTSTWDDAVTAAPALLAQPSPEALPDGYIDPEHQAADRAMLKTYYTACLAEGGTADEITLRGLNAVLARWGRLALAPPAPAELVKLVAKKLQRLASQNPLGIADPTITHAADLLLQQQAQIAELEAELQECREVSAAFEKFNPTLSQP